MRGATHKVVPTPRMLSYWWRWVNDHAFSGALPPGVSFRTHTDEESQGTHGFSTHAIYFPGHLQGFGTISFWKTEQTRRQMVSTLAHEMVHQEQHLLGLPMTHGRQFKQRCKAISKLLDMEVT